MATISRNSLFCQYLIRCNGERVRARLSRRVSEKLQGDGCVWETDGGRIVGQAKGSGGSKVPNRVLGRSTDKRFRPTEVYPPCRSATWTWFSAIRPKDGRYSTDEGHYVVAKKANEEKDRPTTDPMKGDFIAPPEVEERDEWEDALPQQEAFWRPPTRFGSMPVEKVPLGWDRRRGFRKLFPQVMLPFQVVERVSFGHPALEPNRLFWGDNLHVMRQLPSESIDLIYIDPPFFSGRHYNVIFGDQNELRSFSDIWEGGMPGYLIWLNARLYEMKRLLKKTGSIYVHCDWHASHYIKVEMDMIFGANNFINEIVWYYSQGGKSKQHFARKHDVLL